MIKKVLNFYFDFHCPYSYLAWELLMKLRMEFPCQVELFGIGLYPPSSDKLHGRKIWSDDRWKSIKERGLKMGLVIEKPKAFEFSRLPLIALDSYAGIGLKEYVSATFRGFFQKGVDLQSSKVLGDYLQSEGVDTQPFYEALESPKLKKAAQAKELLWGHKRIRMLPTFEIDSERYSGLIEQRGLENFLSLLLSDA